MAGIVLCLWPCHLGMTQAASSGQMVAEDLLEPDKGTDLTAYSIGRFS